MDKIFGYAQIEDEHKITFTVRATHMELVGQLAYVLGKQLPRSVDVGFYPLENLSMKAHEIPEGTVALPLYSKDKELDTSFGNRTREWERCLRPVISKYNKKYKKDR